MGTPEYGDPATPPVGPAAGKPATDEGREHAQIITVPFNELGRIDESDRRSYRSCFDRVLQRGWFLGGPEVESFEREFAERCGLGDVVAVGNGTDALELSLRALGIGQGDEVITVANAGGYTTIATRLVGASPVYVDVAPETLLLDVTKLASAVTVRTRAIVCTHLYGSVVGVDEVRRAAGRTDIAIVEDAAQAHLGTIDGRRVGTLGDITAFSFYPTKNLAALGDAGAVAASRPGLAAAVRQLRQYGWSERFNAERPLGRNSRMDELQAAVLRDRLSRLGERNGRRVEILEHYQSRLSGALTFPRRRDGHVAHLAVALVEDRARFRSSLAEDGITTSVHYPVPDHRQAAFCDLAGADVSLPVTEHGCASVVSLPCFPELTTEEIEGVCRAVDRWATMRGR